ncbi:MAG: 4-(cytidine 5'-diphospho)-2-C-methyl-D-erythritol kinase [Ignavibacteria bacterium]|nr:4-(cytidine 5'-diphospho)-2-C-methyl-D-erythritol kinase [Ignavibacteria bacterium]
MYIQRVHRAYAKINLGLIIRSKRPDGFHNIETVFHTIDLFDEIELTESSAVTVTSSDPEAPGGDQNIAHKAIVLLQRHCATNRGATIHLHKHIPVGAGLGGGSSDAALVMREVPKIWDVDIDDQTLRDLALELGSDVPYFLGDGSALASGRGENLRYFRLDVPFWILLCNPGIHVSTAWAYAHVTASRHRVDLQSIVQEGMTDPALLAQNLTNDFETVVFQRYPEVRQLKEDMIQGGALFALMSGSGSSVFGLFPDEESLDRVDRIFTTRHYTTFRTRPNFSPLR